MILARVLTPEGSRALSAVGLPARASRRVEPVLECVVAGEGDPGSHDIDLDDRPVLDNGYASCIGEDLEARVRCPHPPLDSGVTIPKGGGVDVVFRGEDLGPTNASPQ